MESIWLEPTREITDSPIALFDRTDAGHVRVRLNIRGNQWARLAFQFAHEFCHVMANFRPPSVHPSMWVEESLCEASSLFALQNMARVWQVSPPYENWRSYALSLRDYFDERCADPLHQMPPGGTFAEWITLSLPKLRENPGRREDNTIVALQLLPVFGQQADAWSAVRYLNLWEARADMPLVDYFASWRSVSPTRLHPAIDRFEHTLVPV